MVEEFGGIVPFMINISHRAYENKQDLQIILDVMVRSRPAEHLNDYPRQVDIEENLASAKIRANTRLWFDCDQPIAWAFVDEFNNLWGDIHPPYEDLIGQEIVEWGETCIRMKLGPGETSTLDTNCREDYIERISFLQRYGFQQTEEFNIAMSRQLSEPISAPKLPQGFIIRPIRGNQEAGAVAATHRAAFGTEYMTTENRLALMSTSEYDPSLDLLVIAPDGTIAGYCTCSINQQERKGSTDPIAIHPKYQRMGLARAILLAGLVLLKERGMTSAHLVTSGNNIAMRMVAESVGFVIEHKTLWFSKQIN